MLKKTRKNMIRYADLTEREVKLGLEDVYADPAPLAGEHVARSFGFPFWKPQDPRASEKAEKSPRLPLMIIFLWNDREEAWSKRFIHARGILSALSSPHLPPPFQSFLAVITKDILRIHC